MNRTEQSKQTAEMYAILCEARPGGWRAQDDTIGDAARLVELARRINKRNEDACNYGLTPRQEAMETADEARLAALLAPYALAYRLNGDPRGFSIYVKHPAGASNSWGGNGEWGIG